MKTTLIAGIFAATCLACAKQQVIAEDDYQKLMRLADIGQWDDELPLAERLAKENPTYPNVWLALGWGYKFTGKYAQGYEAFKRANELGAWRRANILLEMASCKSAEGDKEAAITLVGQAIEEGYPFRDRLPGNRFFKPLLDDPRFKKLAGQVDTSSLSRDDRWRTDISFLFSEIPRISPNPNKNLSKDQWADLEQELLASVPSKKDYQLIADIHRVGALLGDAHSGLRLPYSRAETYDAIPVLIGWFDDGVYITGTSQQKEPLLWSQILTIDGMPIAEVMGKLAKVTPRDNEIRPKAIAATYIRYPKLMAGLGLSKSVESVELELKTRGGEIRKVALKSDTTPITSWVRHPADGPGRPPKFADKRDDLYWFEFDAANKILYFQYNGVGDKEDESIAEFAKRMFEFERKNEVENMVVDLRWNGGGDQFLNKPLLQGIIASKANQSGHLFVIAGRYTFSAAIVFAEQLERFTNATMVGDPTGSSPNFTGENADITLPCSGLKFGISNLYWQNSYASDERPYIPPKLYVPYLFSDWKAGRDATMDRIRASIRS